MKNIIIRGLAFTIEISVFTFFYFLGETLMLIILG